MRSWTHSWLEGNPSHRRDDPPPGRHQCNVLSFSNTRNQFYTGFAVFAVGRATGAMRCVLGRFSVVQKDNCLQPINHNNADDLFGRHFQFPGWTGGRGRAVASLALCTEMPGNPECPVWTEHSADPLCRTHLFEQSQFPGRADKLSRPAQQSGRQ